MLLQSKLHFSRHTFQNNFQIQGQSQKISLEGCFKKKHSRSVKSLSNEIWHFQDNESLVAAPQYRSASTGLEHMVIDMQHGQKLNPKVISCLHEESFLKYMKRTGMYVRGLSPQGLMSRMMSRYLINLGLRWRRRKQSGAFKINLG